MENSGVGEEVSDREWKPGTGNYVQSRKQSLQQGNKEPFTGITLCCDVQCQLSRNIVNRTTKLTNSEKVI